MTIVVEAAGEDQRVQQQEPVRPQLIERHGEPRRQQPASTLPPSSGGIGIMLNTASSTLSRIAWLRIAAIGTDTFVSPSVCGEIGSTASSDRGDQRNHQIAGGTGRRHQDVIAAMDAAGCARSTGTGFAQPISGAPVTIAISGNRIVPIGSACTIGLSEMRPSSRAVGSPSRSAVHACAISCTVRENSRTMNEMKTARS